MVCIRFGVDMRFRDYIGLGMEKALEFIKGLGFARCWECILAVGVCVGSRPSSLKPQALNPKTLKIQVSELQGLGISKL